MKQWQMIFSRKPTKTELPIPFPKELSSCQMMHVTGFSSFIYLSILLLLYRVVSAFPNLLIAIFQILQQPVFHWFEWF